MVKADGYGHGSVMTAQAALRSGAQRVGMYTLAEALYLRSNGVAGPILVLGPIDTSQAEECVREAITPCISTVELGEAPSKAATAAALPCHTTSNWTPGSPVRRLPLRGRGPHRRA